MCRGAKASSGLKMESAACRGGKRVLWAVDTGDMAVVECFRKSKLAFEAVEAVEEMARTESFATGVRKHVRDRRDIPTDRMLGKTIGKGQYGVRSESKQDSRYPY